MASDEATMGPPAGESGVLFANLAIPSRAGAVSAIVAIITAAAVTASTAMARGAAVDVAGSSTPASCNWCC